ncbi:MAG: hypothetical protein ABIK73_08665 [candidate division WOR-3 bacterium]
MIELAGIALIFVFAVIAMLSNRISIAGLAIIAITSVILFVNNAYVLITAILAIFLITLVFFVKIRTGW